MLLSEDRLTALRDLEAMLNSGNFSSAMKITSTEYNYLKDLLRSTEYSLTYGSTEQANLSINKFSSWLMDRFGDLTPEVFVPYMTDITRCVKTLKVY